MKLSFKVVSYLFEKNLASKSYSDSTIRRYKRDIKEFSIWLFNHARKDDMREVDKNDIIQYQKYIFHLTKPFKEEKRYSESTQKGIMSALVVLFRYLSRNEYILTNPFIGIDLKMQRRYKIRRTLTQEEMNLFLDSIRECNVLDIRDRCLFELMYGTGLRISEVAALDITDVDLNIGKLFVKNGKGRKERVIPLGRCVIKNLKQYIRISRGKLLKKAKGSSYNEGLFLTCSGMKIKNYIIRKLLKMRLKIVGINTKGISPHVLRHSFATHMLENGASLKHIKEILGHKDMQTTVIYTHFSVKSLNKILKMYHPKENELYEDVNLKNKFVRALKD